MNDILYLFTKLTKNRWNLSGQPYAKNQENNLLRSLWTFTFEKKKSKIVLNFIKLVLKYYIFKLKVLFSYQKGNFTQKVK